ncbi:putative Spidroin-1 [Streptantibioticus cattleyicolor NRRL 8057 = DSM 46488]|nr:putative Spidroin-1 [Streptantibioticus cattleyicolor NRRL 8057 = DSM 46488]
MPGCSGRPCCGRYSTRSPACLLGGFTGLRLGLRVPAARLEPLGEAAEAAAERVGVHRPAAQAGGRFAGQAAAARHPLGQPLAGGPGRLGGVRRDGGLLRAGVFGGGFGGHRAAGLGELGRDVRQLGGVVALFTAAVVVGAGQQGVRQDDHGGDPALLVLAQLDPDAVPAGHAGHQVEPEAAGDRRVVRVGVGEQGVGLGEPGLRHADAGVLDREHDLAVLQQPAGDPHVGVGRREGGGVLQQFGEHVAGVVGREAGQAGTRQGGDAHPLVPFDLGDGGPHHVEQGHRAGLGAAAGLRAGQYQQRLAVAPHPGGQVVQPEEGLELVGVLLALLQALDERELAFDEGEGAQREADVGGARGVLQGDQAGGQRLLLGFESALAVAGLLPGGVELQQEVVALGGEALAQFVAFGGEALFELVAFGGEAATELGAFGDRLLARGAEAFAFLLALGGLGAQPGGLRGDPVDGAGDGGELVVAVHRHGDGPVAVRVGGGEAQQAAEGTGQRAGGADAEAEGDQGAAGDHGGVDLQRRDVVVAQPGQPGGVGAGQRGLHGPHPVHPGGERGVHVGGAQPVVGGGQVALGGQPVQIALGGGHVGAGDGLRVPGTGLLGGGGVEVGERRQLTGTGLLGAAGQGGGGAARGERGDQLAPGGGGVLHRGGQRGSGGGVGVGGPGRQRPGQRAADRVQRVDQRGVGVEGRLGVAGSGQGALPHLRQRGQGAGQVAGDPDQVGGVAGVEHGGVRGDLGGLPVDPGPFLLRDAPADGVAVRGGGGFPGAASGGHVGGHVGAFVGQRVGKRDGRRVELAQPQQPLRLGDVGHAAGHPGGARGEHRCDGYQQGGDQASPHSPFGPRRSCTRFRAPSPRCPHRFSQSCSRPSVDSRSDDKSVGHPREDTAQRPHPASPDALVCVTAKPATGAALGAALPIPSRGRPVDPARREAVTRFPAVTLEGVNNNRKLAFNPE